MAPFVQFSLLLSDRLDSFVVESWKFFITRLILYVKDVSRKDGLKESCLTDNKNSLTKEVKKFKIA